MLVDEAHDPADHVADTAGQVFVCTCQEPFDCEVGVDGLGDISAEPPSQGVSAAVQRDVGGIDSGTGRLRELDLAQGEIRMDSDVGRERLAGGEREGGPVDGVEAEDALADDVVRSSAPVHQVRYSSALDCP